MHADVACRRDFGGCCRPSATRCPLTTSQRGRGELQQTMVAQQLARSAFFSGAKLAPSRRQQVGVVLRGAGTIAPQPG